MNVTTDPKESEEAPRGNEARFRLLFEKSPDAMLLLDEDAFVDCNQAAVEMMGCACKEQLLALHPYDISPERQPDGRLSSEKASELIDKVHQQGNLCFEWVHRRMDGQDFPAEVLLTAIPLPDRQILHASLKDIAERLGLSITTVSRALGGYPDVAKETRERVMQAAREMGYYPDAIAQKLQKRRTDTVGFIIPTFGPRFADPFFSEFLAGIGNEASRLGMDLLVATHPPGPTEIETYRRWVGSRRVDGFVLVRTRRNDPRIRYLSNCGALFVAYGRSDWRRDERTF